MPVESHEVDSFVVIHNNIRDEFRNRVFVENVRIINSYTNMNYSVLEDSKTMIMPKPLPEIPKQKKKKKKKLFDFFKQKKIT